jgi:hypothetical protein
MITANQIKDKVAQRYNFSTWYHIPVEQRLELVNECINEALNEQLDIPVVMQAEGSEMCGSDCCPNDGACEHCQNPIRKSAEG